MSKRVSLGYPDRSNLAISSAVWQKTRTVFYEGLLGVLLLIVALEDRHEALGQVVEVAVLDEVPRNLGADVVGRRLERVDQLPPLAVPLGPEAEASEEFLLHRDLHAKLVGRNVQVGLQRLHRYVGAAVAPLELDRHAEGLASHPRVEDRLPPRVHEVAKHTAGHKIEGRREPARRLHDPVRDRGRRGVGKHPHMPVGEDLGHDEVAECLLDGRDRRAGGRVVGDRVVDAQHEARRAVDVRQLRALGVEAPVAVGQPPKLEVGGRVGRVVAE